MKTKFSQWLKKIGLSLKNSLSLYETLSLLISLVGALSLVFLVIQTMQAAANMKLAEKSTALSEKSTDLAMESKTLSVASMKSSMYEIMNVQTLEMDKIFLERPHLRPYFYDNEGLPKIRDKKTLNEVMVVAEYQLDFFDLVMTQLDYIPDDPDSVEDKANWYAYFADSFANSPALCKRIDEDPEWYMTKLVNFAKKNCKTSS